MCLAKVESLIGEDRMEWVAGEREVLRKGVWVVVECWIPVARFKVQRHWRKKASYDGRSAVPVMQLVP